MCFAHWLDDNSTAGGSSGAVRNFSNIGVGRYGLKNSGSMPRSTRHSPGSSVSHGQRPANFSFWVNISPVQETWSNLSKGQRGANSGR